MKIKLSKSQWQFIGKKAGWINKKANSNIVNELLSTYKPEEIVNAIKILGEQSVAGFSDISVSDIKDILESCELYELQDIKNTLIRQRKRI